MYKFYNYVLSLFFHQFRDEYKWNKLNKSDDLCRNILINIKLKIR